jgi:hypothetical protein
MGARQCFARRRLFPIALVVVGLAAAAGGCAFDGEIGVQLGGESPVVVTESSKPELTPHRVQGVTTRPGQVARIDCSITIVYDVNEASGSAVLAQSYLVHLRTRRLPRRTAYDLDCTGPLIVEIPSDASSVQATATDASGLKSALPVQAPMISVPLAFGRHLRAEPGTQLALVSWPRTLSPGEYQVELAFSIPEARAIREKALYTVSVSCGRSRYLQPVLPLVASMARVPAFTIEPSAGATKLVLPRIAGAAGTQAAARQTLSCPR